MMKKYWTVVANSFNKNNAYRSNTLIMMIAVLLSFGIIFYFWSSIYRQGNQIGTYSFAEIVTYYVFIAIFDLVFTANTAWSITDEIKSGQLNTIILRPIGYLQYKFSQLIGLLIYRLVFMLPIIAAVLFVLRNFLTKPQEQFGYGQFLLLAVLAYVMNFLFFYLVGILAFWLSDSYGFIYAAFIFLGFFEGQLMPLDLLPSFIVKLGNVLPFKYLFFVPVAVGSGRMKFDFSMVWIPLLWCLVLMLVAEYVYHKGLKKYEGYGV